MIPEVLSKALAVSFDTHIGHDFLNDSDERYEFYHRSEVRVPFDLDYFNKITKGGVPKKTLNIALAGTGVGKSLFMCHCAAANLTRGLNVLYITLEMAEEKIAERIDANLLDVTIDELSMLPKESYDKKISRLKSNTHGKLIIKEYPTASAGSGNFRHLLNELKMKKNFVPDVIYIDYLNICASSRLRYGANVNSYTYVKAIAEELRGLAVEFNVPIFSATQTTRSGYSNTDVGLEDTSESFGLPATADFMFALISTEELQDLNQILVKQLKNRYSDPSFYKRFIVGVDRARMKLYDVEQTAQEDLIDTPLMDQSTFGQRMNEESSRKPSFEGFR
jgi:archaellum biogenesis ATPase FlaH